MYSQIGVRIKVIRYAQSARFDQTSEKFLKKIIGIIKSGVDQQLSDDPFENVAKVVVYPVEDFGNSANAQQCIITLVKALPTAEDPIVVHDVG
jgi:hypothetical protein